MQKQLLTNGNAFKRTDGRWGGVVWYKDEKGERKRKSFSGTTKAEVNKKMTDYITKFEEEIIDAIEGNKTVKDSLLNYLQVFKYPNVERVTYDRNEQIYKNQIVPYMGKLIVSNITGADIKRLISTLTDKGYSFSTVKQTYNLLNEYFDYLMREEFIKKNPMNAVPTIKKSNYLAKQNKEVLPVCETITVFTDEEIEKFKAEAYKKYPSGKPKHNQASAYILMLNTGLRTAEALGLINSDIDLEKKVMHIQRGVKEAQKRDGTERKSGREIVVGKLKTASSKRIVPLNETAIQAIIELRNERYFGEGAPLIPDADGNFTRPLNLRKRFYSILDAAGIEKKGLHSLRHPYVKHTTKIFSLRLMDFQAQAYPDARRKTRGACQLHQGGQSRIPVRPLCNRKRFSYLPPQSKMSWILYAISMRLSGYTSTRSISSSASSVVSVSASKIALDASLRLSCRVCSSCFCFACANTAA